MLQEVGKGLAMRTFLRASTHSVGEHLRGLRERRGLPRRRVARSVGVGWTSVASWELGRRHVPASTAPDLARLYDVEVEDLRPPRRPSPIRVTREAVSVGEVQRPLEGEPDVESVLERYLDAVYALRGLRRADDLALRDEDVEELAAALGDEPEEIERRLMQLVRCTREEARTLRKALLRRRVLIPAAGVALGVGGLTPALAQSGGGDDTPSTTSTTVAPAAVEEVVETPETSVPGAPAATTSTVAVVPDGSSDRGDDWAEVDEPLTVYRGEDDEDWAELIPPLVVERDAEDSQGS